MATEPRCFSRYEDGNAVPKEQFWSYVLYICNVGDLSLLEKLLSQYHDQPVRLHEGTDHMDDYAFVQPTRISCFPGSAESQQQMYFDAQYSADDESDEACSARMTALGSSRRLYGTTTLRKRPSHVTLADHLAYAPSLPDAMVLAAVLGSQIAIVDYLFTEFRPFLSLNDGLISAVLESPSSLKMFKVLHGHCPCVVRYRFRITLQASSETDSQQESLAPSINTPMISVLQEAMSRSQINPKIHNVILFLIENGALLDEEEVHAPQHHDIIQWATWTAQPLSIIRACLEQGRAKVHMVSIYFAVQHGNYELLHLLLTCGRPTKDEVSTGELIRLARLPVAAFTTDNEDAVARCCTMMREYLLARVIHSRASPAGGRGGGIRRRRTNSIRSMSSIDAKHGSRRHTEAYIYPKSCNDSTCQGDNMDGKGFKPTCDISGTTLLTRLHSLDSDISRRSIRRDFPSARDETRCRSLYSSLNEAETTTGNNSINDLDIPFVESPKAIDNPSPWTTIKVSPRSRRHITFSSLEAADVLEIIEEGSLIHVKCKTSGPRTSEDKARERQSKDSRRRDSSIIRGAREKVRKSLSGFF